MNPLPRPAPPHHRARHADQRRRGRGSADRGDPSRSLEELYMERSSTESHIGNIYKGRVTNVEPSIQAAFIDFGIGKNGFLHISDVHPQYFPRKHQPRMPLQRRGPQGPRNAPRPAGSVGGARSTAKGFVPPAARATPDGGTATAPAESAPGVMEHQVAVDTPVVQLDGGTCAAGNRRRRNGQWAAGWRRPSDDRAGHRR